MSLTPMELESQAMQIQGAHGKVGIGGLGMGMALFNILKKGSVTKVYVYERQPNVIELLKKATDLKEWIGIEKLQIIEKNIFTAEPAVPLDYLYLDIWPLLGDNRAIPDTQKIQKRFQARHVTWWGLELDFIDFMRDAKINFFDRKSIDIVRWREALELPIYVGRHDWFLDSIEAVAMNVITGGFL